MIPFNLKQLETFLIAAELGSFKKAADRLNTTQPAISTRIAGLESALGTKLFERSNVVQLTADGQKLLSAAQRVLSVAQKLQVAASNLTEATGTLRIGVAETVVHTWFPALLHRLTAEFPNINTDLVIDSSSALRIELMEHRVDLAVLMGPVHEFNIGNIELNTTPLVWAASPELDLPDDRALTLCELVRYPLITYPRTTQAYAEIYHKLTSESEDPPRIFPTSGFASALRMAIDGIGIASLPIELIERYAHDGRLAIRECNWKPSPLQFTVSFPLATANPIVERAAQIAAETARAHQAKREIQAAGR